MAIKLDALPKERPTSDYALPPEGMQKMKIVGQTVKTSSSGNEYLEVTYENAEGAKMWDRLMLSDSQHVQFKFQRFLTACRVPLTGEITFEDLGRLVEGKELYVDVIHKENEYQGKVTTKAEVDIFTGDVYRPVGEEAPAETAATPASGSY